MVNQHIRRVTGYLVEGIAAMIIVLVFFGIFVSLLTILFPVGTSLRAVIASGTFSAPGDLAEKAIREMLISSGSETTTKEGVKKAAAVLAQMRNTVKSKRVEAIAWTDARKGMKLYDRDAVQTLRRSSALIKFDAQNRLRMGQNSLLIIKSLEQDVLIRQKQSFLVMVDGELQGKLAGADEESVQIEITTPSAVARVKTERSEQPVDFSIRIHPDRSSTFTVYEGTAMVTAKGKQVRINPNTSTTVGLNREPPRPAPLPDPVRLAAPVDAAVITYRERPPPVRFTWDALSGATGYRFVLARDRRFEGIVADETGEQIEFLQDNLGTGTYFWRVSAQGSTGEGRFSRIRMLRVVQDRRPPRLEVTFPPETIPQARCELNGRTEPGARVFVMGEEVRPDPRGRFSHMLKLDAGMNIIIVEAVDAAGNVTYRSRNVNVKH